MNNIEQIGYSGKLILIAVFAIAFAYVEATVVVYLRELIYPEGFAFPLKTIPFKLILIELLREFATIVMLVSAALMVGRKIWERFGYFIVAFGVWDIFFYVWLKATIDWPSSLTEWDILFLLPVPWIGPLIAPALVSVLMIVTGTMITRLYYRNREFRPGWLSWVLSLMATAFVLYSFICDFEATLAQQMPQSYHYSMLIVGLLLYSAAFAIAYNKAIRA